MSALKEWILSVAAASLLSAVALTLCPQGRVRQVTRLVCGIVCALALASPVVKLDVGSLSAGMAGYEKRALEITQDAEEEKKMLERTYIERECAAYILAKATETGADVTDAAVLARWDDGLRAWYPWQATLTGTYSAALAEAIETELGIPAGRQDWSGG